MIKVELKLKARTMTSERQCEDDGRGILVLGHVLSQDDGGAGALPSPESTAKSSATI